MLGMDPCGSRSHSNSCAAFPRHGRPLGRRHTAHVWIEEDPYRSLAAGLRVAELRGEVERSTAVLTPIDGAITIGGRGAVRVRAAVAAPRGQKALIADRHIGIDDAVAHTLR